MKDGISRVRNRLFKAFLRFPLCLFLKVAFFIFLLLPSVQFGKVKSLAGLKLLKAFEVLLSMVFIPTERIKNEA